MIDCAKERSRTKKKRNCRIVLADSNRTPHLPTLYKTPSTADNNDNNLPFTDPCTVWRSARVNERDRVQLKIEQR